MLTEALIYEKNQKSNNYQHFSFFLKKTATVWSLTEVLIYKKNHKSKNSQHFFGKNSYGLMGIAVLSSSLVYHCDHISDTCHIIKMFYNDEAYLFMRQNLQWIDWHHGPPAVRQAQCSKKVEEPDIALAIELLNLHDTLANKHKAFCIVSCCIEHFKKISS